MGWRRGGGISNGSIVGFLQCHHRGGWHLIQKSGSNIHKRPPTRSQTKQQLLSLLNPPVSRNSSNNKFNLPGWWLDMKHKLQPFGMECRTFEINKNCSAASKFASLAKPKWGAEQRVLFHLPVWPRVRCSRRCRRKARRGGVCRAWRAYSRRVCRRRARLP